MVLQADQTEKCPPHFWVENPHNHTKTCIWCHTTIDLTEAQKKMLKQPVSRSILSDQTDDFFVEKKVRYARKKATAY